MTGPVGPPGLQGPRGETGIQGPSGQKEERGENGTSGFPEASGLVSYKNWKECAWNNLDDPKDNGLIKVIFLGACVYQVNVVPSNFSFLIKVELKHRY